MEPIVSLASVIQSSPGTTALLLGSGVSRSAQIPTGWEVALDLIRRVAKLRGIGELPEPERWYREQFGADPDYSVLLEELAPSPAERRNLLGAYFQPTPDEREDGIKVPTAAHRSVARLIAGGYVRVVVTTNFDRLLEGALAEIGIDPVVISSSAGAQGAAPLVHTDCTIIKLHGDYLDPNTKNTLAELATYEPSVNGLLDRVLDEYGLVVCGWSGEWDEALRHAILRCPTRRYTTWWASRATPDGKAGDLVSHRAAVHVPIADADTFFDDLTEKVAALADAITDGPLSTALAIAQLKRYLPDQTQRIRLHDLLASETSRALPAVRLEPPTGTPSSELIAAHLRGQEAIAAPLLPLLATAAKFADGTEQAAMIRAQLRRIASGVQRTGGYTVWVDGQWYPVTLCLYAIVMGGIAGDNPAAYAPALTLADLDADDPAAPVYVSAASWRVLNAEACNVLVREHDGERRKTPASDYLHRTLRVALADVVNEDEFDDLFDQAEYLLGVLCAAARGDGRGPIGRFAWRTSVQTPADRAFAAHLSVLVANGLLDEEQASEASRAVDEAARGSRFW